MEQKSFIQLGVVVVIAAVVQLIWIAAEFRQTPVRTAEEFVRNYYYLDPDMEEQLCAELSNDGETVTDYLYNVTSDAAQRGFSTKYVRRMFTHLKIETLERSADLATVHVHGQTRTAVNPVFMVIGKLFRLGENHPVDLFLNLKKENGQWRVCGQVAGLNS